ncbi:membrane protein [Kitasatospora sp. MMS16-BH015]|uniref:helix-turn-helix domain-containing protein n=1 Tax=Kitasatospora sp. MMS16-BH015 TaxID=2018025 RepID=UPI000CA29A24|nr:RodZ domain-containing protein [Kitasatospora sp. MMS16-BH015]AUG79909.1 membrane protein [Kitasatospora sp. MMS16-BH015]
MTIGKSPHRDNRRSLAPAEGAVPEPVRAPATEAASIGSVLSAARLRAGLTVDQVSTDTRVRVPIVHAIEEDDFGRCGGDFYARGHIRAIARKVGVDGEALVAQYDAAHGGAPVTQPRGQLLDTGPIKITDHRRPNWTTAMVLAIVAVVGLIGFNLVSGGPSRSTSAGAASAPLPSASAAPATVTPSAQPPAPAPSIAAIAAAPADKVTVKLVAEKDTSWVSALDGAGKSLFQNNLDQGKDQTFTDPKQIKLVIGNAGAVHVYVNGKDLGAAGEDGQVVHLTYTPGDPQAG